jgi:hypothetical protein
MRAKPSLQSSRGYDLMAWIWSRSPLPRLFLHRCSRLVDALHSRLEKNSSNLVQFKGNVSGDNSPRSVQRRPKMLQRLGNLDNDGTELGSGLNRLMRPDRCGQWEGRSNGV